MFEELHALTGQATLLVVIAREGDLLRVGVTPTPASRTDKPALRPLSLLATAAELDAGFAGALLAWQAPKRSLLEQVQDGAAQDDSNDGEGDAENGKPKGRKAGQSGAKAAGAKPKRAARDDVTTSTTAAAVATPTEAPADAAVATDPATDPVAEQDPEPAPPPADTFTLDIF